MDAETLLREISSRFQEHLDKQVIVDGQAINFLEFDINRDAILLNTEPIIHDEDDIVEDGRKLVLLEDVPEFVNEQAENMYWQGHRLSEIDQKRRIAAMNEMTEEQVERMNEDKGLQLEDDEDDLTEEDIERLEQSELQPVEEVEPVEVLPVEGSPPEFDMSHSQSEGDESNERDTGRTD